MGASYLYFQKVPLGWRDAPAVVALASHIHKRDPRLLLLDLWDWAKAHGVEHPTTTAADVLERGAGWRGKRGLLYAGLVAAGWVREQDGLAIILDWEKDGIVRGRPTMPDVIPAGEEILDEDEKKKMDARLRQKKSRDKKKGVTSEIVTCHTDSVTERDASVTSIVTDPSNRPESTVYAGIVTPKIEDKEKDKDKNNNLALFENRKDAGRDEQPSRPRRGRPPKDRSPEAEAERTAEKADADRWIEKARALIGLTAEEAPWSSATFMAFRQARKKRGLDQLMRALDGLQGDPWATKQSLQTLLSASLIEKGLAKWNADAGSKFVSRQDHIIGKFNLDDLYREAK